MIKKLCWAMVLVGCIMVPDYAMNPPKKRRLDTGDSATVINKGLDADTLIKAAKRGVLLVLWPALAKYHADPDACDQNGTTALMWASLYGHLDTVRALLVFGAEVDAHDNKGTTALMVASMNGQVKVVQQLLVQDARVSVQSMSDMTTLMENTENIILARGAHVDAHDEDGRTALMWAAIRGHDEVVRILLEAGAAADLVGNGRTALAWAQVNGHQKVIQVFKDYFATRFKGST